MHRSRRSGIRPTDGRSIVLGEDEGVEDMALSKGTTNGTDQTRQGNPSYMGTFAPTSPHEEGRNMTV